MKLRRKRKLFTRTGECCSNASSCHGHATSDTSGLRWNPGSDGDGALELRIRLQRTCIRSCRDRSQVYAGMAFDFPASGPDAAKAAGRCGRAKNAIRENSNRSIRGSARILWKIPAGFQIRASALRTLGRDNSSCSTIWRSAINSA